MATDHSYDLVVLGGGAAAFAAITEADRRNLSTAMVNTGLPLGGTCVNVGCVPSKHLLAVGKTAYEPPHNPFDAVAYDDTQPRTDWSVAIDEKDGIVASLREQNYVDVADHFGTDTYEGYGRVVDDTAIQVVGGEDAGTTIMGEKVLVATGSSPHIAPIDGIETVSYETSETILERRNLPESIVMIGGGYVALEWGQILHHMGADVTILQRSSRVLSEMAGQLGRELQRCFEAEGITVETDVDVRRVSEGGETGNGVTVEAIVAGDSQTFTADDLFVATGVSPNTDDIGLDEVGVETDNTGAIVVDDEFQTVNPDVYAAGDCIGEPMLETVAAKEGNHAVRNAFGDESATIDYHAVPKVVFTSPEVAAVGMTELDYMDEHDTCTCRTVEMEDIPKAKAVEDTRGLVQVVKHHETDEIVGVHMAGPRAGDMIPEATLAVKFGLTVDDIIDTIHPFPAFSEAFKHACQAFRRDTSKMSCCVE
ncbi:mercury(II) reductase [Haloarcula nitratireducens]|uniref:Mercuric reductase n=1 Tax=Haloarcula nitratireducens TaxID=2487749 RepID=A0AAW4PJG6_9EURY|nr:mercury(II) reductase [Halomicroarcula nitratireducens]MBX0298118.1 mercury(II) reductase [Halomicroarcula nitratireducens]